MSKRKSFFKIIILILSTVVVVWILINLHIYLYNLRMVNTIEPYYSLKVITETENVLYRMPMIIDSSSGFLGANDGTVVYKVKPIFTKIDWSSKTENWHDLPLRNNFDNDYNLEYSSIYHNWRLSDGIQDFVDNLESGKYFYIPDKSNSFNFVFYIWEENNNEMYLVYSH